ncbi:MAG TPA: selenocysteine-specific translation elongation factor [Actinoplanes sp.]
MHVIATAGHVDHGKSTLVRALTGMEPDRWAEERRRGMTIDLGFAWTTLPDGQVAAFVDVPGHQKFITNMLAGIGPVAAVLLVVAADEGWGRQTGEHLAALHALGVEHGVLAVTRADLGDADLAVEEARDYLAGTRLAGIEAVAVSPVTGAGLDDLRAALSRLTGALPPPPEAPARMWIDRCFSVRGSGTVITGTLSSGRIAVGDEVELAPTGRRIRVRGLQSLQEDVAHAHAVARLGVNLRGVKSQEIHRGQALITPGSVAPVSIVDVRLTDAADELATELVLHVGSAAVPVHVRRFTDDTARLRLAHPAPVHAGERALLRDPGIQRIVAGVVLLDTMPPPLRRRGAAARRAAALTAMPDRPDPDGEVRRRGAIRHRDLVAAGILGSDDKTPPSATRVGDWYVDTSLWRRWATELTAAADRWATANPMTPGLPRTAAVQQLDLPDPRLLDALIPATGQLVSGAQGVHRPGVAATLPDQVSNALTDLRESLAAEPFAAWEADALAERGLSDRHLATAAGQGLLLKVADGIFLLPEAAELAADRVGRLPQPFTLSEARQVLNTTRRVAVPLLELLDRRGLTRRIDGSRRTVSHASGS